MIGAAEILNARILIVDDLAANVALLEQILRGAGYRAVSSTMNPREVCTLHRQHHYDLILLDLQMPGLDGFEVMEGLQEIEPGGYLPVLVITAQPDHKLRALKAGAKDFLSTPFDLPEVLVRVHNLIEVRLLLRNEAAQNLLRLENSQRIAGIGDWEHDFASGILLWSEEVYRILGLARQDYPPDSAIFYRQVHPDDLAFVHEQKKLAAAGRRMDFEHRLIRSDGEVRHIHQITEMVFDALGQPARESGTLHDITERKLADESLRRSEERFAGAFEHAPSGMALVAPDGRWLLVNRALCEVLGYTEAELLARSFQDITHPEDLGVDLEYVRRLLAGDIRSYQMEKRYLKAQGEVVTALLNVSLVRDEEGRPRYFISHIQDISARKRAEAALQQERALFASLSSTSPDFIYFKDRQSRFVRINDAQMRAFGLPDVAAAVGKSDHDFFDGAHAQKAYNDEQRIMATGEPMVDLEEMETWPDGRVSWVSSTKVPQRDAAGRITGLIGISRDITSRRLAEAALRESEQWLRAVFEQAAVGVVQTDIATGRFRRVNQRFCDIVGYTPEEITRLTFADITHPQDLGPNLDKVQRLRSGFVREFAQEKRYVRKDGSSVWTSVAVSAIGPPGEPPVSFIAFVQDISERKLLDEHVLQAQRMEALGQFSGGVAHDFNNILAAISGYAELSRMRLKDNPEVREHLGAVLKATGRATDLVRQILTFSHQEPQERRVIHLQPIVAESLKLMRAIIPATIGFERSVEADAPTVLANGGQVHQILMNLGINAWHAMKDHTGRLLVTLEKFVVTPEYAATTPRLHPGDYVRISVSDTGCGMDPATLRRIYEPFFTTKAPGEGTGLGLSVVHGIMDSHDGAITVHSQPGEGTVFRLYFPVHAGLEARPVVAAGPTPRGHGERVLVVDDEESLAQVGENILTRLGYTVESTTEPAKALELVRTDPSRYALVLTDQTMPGMTGLQLASRLREVQPRLPIMLMTGYNLSLTTDRLGASGICNLLLKPFTVHTLGTAVHTTLSHHSLAPHGSHSPD